MTNSVPVIAAARARHQGYQLGTTVALPGARQAADLRRGKADDGWLTSHDRNARRASFFICLRPTTSFGRLGYGGRETCVPRHVDVGRPPHGPLSE